MKRMEDAVRETRAKKMGLDPEKLRQLLAQQYEKENEAAAQPDSAGTGAGTETQPSQEEFVFDLKPEELESYLNQYVVGQHEAKAILSTKICTHFNCLRLPKGDDDDIVGTIKNNVLMIGPTGVGKTYLIKLIARKLGVPFVKGDATKFSETGYVGGDVEDLVRELVREAGGDIERAQHGIIYVDEIDKIASSRTSVGPDVSRSGVQRNLLKLMEETDVDLKSPHDLGSQMEAVMQMQRTGKVEKQKVNTRNILFIVSGAFAGLDEIIAKRLNRGAIGFQLQSESGNDSETEHEELFKHTRAEDFMEYGFESEFIGRLPIVAVLSPLNQDDLLSILRSPKSSVIRAKKRDFRAYGIELSFEDAALIMLAERAFEEHTGARGLVGAIEKALILFEKSLPSAGTDRFTVTDEVVRDPKGSLDRVLTESSLEHFLYTFEQEHGARLTFESGAENQVKKMAAGRSLSPEDLCKELFSDYGHGLKLLEQREFTITTDILANPQEALNSLIKEFYSNKQ